MKDLILYSQQEKSLLIRTKRLFSLIPRMMILQQAHKTERELGLSKTESRCLSGMMMPIKA
jgi:hypothetical protein